MLKQQSSSQEGTIHIRDGFCSSSNVIPRCFGECVSLIFFLSSACSLPARPCAGILVSGTFQETQNLGKSEPCGPDLPPFCALPFFLPAQDCCALGNEATVFQREDRNRVCPVNWGEEISTMEHKPLMSWSHILPSWQHLSPDLKAEIKAKGRENR